MDAITGLSEQIEAIPGYDYAMMAWEEVAGEYLQTRGMVCRMKCDGAETNSRPVL